MVSKVVSFLLFSFLFTQLYSQKIGTATVSGIIHSADGENIPGITVSLKGTSKITTTDANGRFLLKNIPAGAYVLQLSSIGYTSLEHALILKPGISQDISLSLSESRKDLQAVTITAKNKAQEIKESGFAVNAIEIKQFANNPADLGQILNRSTGIKMREQGGMGSDFQFSVNGLSGRAVRFFIDGVPLEIMGSTMNLNNIPVNLAERVEVYKGVAPVELGADALGGAVNIVTSRKMYSYLDVSHSYGSFNTNQSAVTGQYAHKASGFVAKVSGFFNYSDNNYKVHGEQVWDAIKNEYVEKSFRRFHDQYKSGMAQAEIGYAGKKWADAFFIGAGFTKLDKDIQTGITQNIVYGAVTKKGDGFNTNLRYKKEGLLHGRLGLNYYGAYSADNYVIADTTLRKYSWDGSYIAGNPETGSFRVTHVDRPRYFSRLYANYQLAGHHSLHLNYTFDQTKNNTYNILIEPNDPMPGKLTKNLAGLGYRQELLEGRLTNTFMGKFYGIGLRKRQYDYSLGQMVLQNSFKDYYGYGLASVFKFTAKAGVKASFEHTYRLQEVDEVFGDGYEAQNNLDLRPESSDNINIGAFYGAERGRHKLFLEAAGFYRRVNDYIYAKVGSNSQRQYQNLSNVLVTGGETELRYTWNKLVAVTLNATYQYAVDNTKTVENSGSGTTSVTYRNKIPNQPWLFGNADISIGKNNLIGKDSRLQLNWNLAYTHEYYLSWAAYATANSLVTIPGQTMQNIILAYSFQQGRYNLSLEARNITDQLLYDNFRLQKPGRAFFVKARIFLK